MPFWYYFRVTDLPAEIVDSSKQVMIKGYLCNEGNFVKAGTPIIAIENRLAKMILKAHGAGVLKKTFFAPNTYVGVGDSVAIIGEDGENLPYHQDSAQLEIVEMKSH